MQFRELKVGQRFEFADTVRYGMEPGPWVKVSARKYHKDTTPFGTREQSWEHQDWHGLECQVGTIDVQVIPNKDNVQ